MSVDFDKYADGLVPAIVQDAATGKVLMLGYMNRAALEKTRETRSVTFYSRSRRALWTKGETSGNFLKLENVLIDCDSDALLVKATPAGATCHTGADTCFNEKNTSDDFLDELEATIWQRKQNPSQDSYTSKLFARGTAKISQKVGEEAVELVIEANHTDNDHEFKSEAADLMYHLLVLLADRGVKLKDIADVLRERRK